MNNKTMCLTAAIAAFVGQVLLFLAGAFVVVGVVALPYFGLEQQAANAPLMFRAVKLAINLGIVVMLVVWGWQLGRLGKRLLDKRNSMAQPTSPSDVATRAAPEK